MRYELLVQPAQAGEPYDPAKVDQLLAERAPLRPDGVRVWRLKHGELEVRPLIEGGAPIATVLRVPLTGQLDLIREAVAESAALAKDAGGVLFDPQLSRAVTAADDGTVSDQYYRTARYAGEIVGVSEAVGVGMAPPTEGLKPGTKVFLGVAAVFVVVYWLIERLAS